MQLGPAAVSQFKIIYNLASGIKVFLSKLFYKNIISYANHRG